MINFKFDLKSNVNQNTAIVCPTGTITHSKCRYCKQVWCPLTLKQDWCPNPECSHGIKGNKFKPYDEHHEWVKCSTCEMWFKTPDILAVHKCYSIAVPAIGGDDLPGIGGEGLVHWRRATIHNQVAQSY